MPFVLMALASLIIFISISGFLFADLFFYGTKSKEIEIPNLVGMSAEDISLGDAIEIRKNYVFSDSVPSGVVICQTRHGKIKVRDGESVSLDLTVSMGMEKRLLPNLCGLDIYEASGIIRELGCVPKTVFSESDEAFDSVLFSLPSANTELHRGEVVTIYVAKRKSGITVSVPDFYGYSFDGLQARVESAGLTMGKIEFIYSEDFLPNAVIYQSIGKNCLVKQGETVDFYVSRLPEN